MGNQSVSGILAAAAAALLLAGPNIACAEWTIEHPDDPSTTISGDGARPQRVAAYQTAAAALWDLGIRCNEGLLAYWGLARQAGEHDRALTWHKQQLGDVDTQCTENWDTGSFGLEVNKAAQARPDLLLSLTYAGWDFSINETQLKDAYGQDNPPLLKVEVKNRTALDIAETFLDIVKQLGTGHSDFVSHHCSAMQFAINDTIAAAQDARQKGVSVLAGAFKNPNVDRNSFVASPVEDPFLSLLETLGVPLVHPDVNLNMSDVTSRTNDDTPYFWEVTTIDGIQEKYGNTTDVFLYDVRRATIESRFNHEISDTHPGFQSGQLAPWPVETSFSFTRITEFLHKVAPVLRHADAVNPETPCEDNSNPRAFLSPGHIRCDGALSPNQEVLGDGYCSSKLSRESWRFIDDRNVLVGGASKPQRMLVHAQIADALQDMGLDECDQIAGVFSAHGRKSIATTPLRSASLDRTDDCLTSFGSVGIAGVLRNNATELNDMRVDAIVTFRDQVTLEDTLKRRVPVVVLNSENISAVESANRVRELARNVANEPNSLGEEESAYCHILEDDWISLEQASMRARQRNVKVVAINPWDENNVFIGNPVVHPHLRTLEQMGVPLIHPTSDPSKKWVNVPFSEIENNPDDALLGASVVLFTDRGVDFITQVNDTALKDTFAYSNGQISPWHISFASSYKGIKRGIEELIPLLRNAEALSGSDLSCVSSNNFDKALGKGNVRCYMPEGHRCNDGVFQRKFPMNRVLDGLAGKADQSEVENVRAIISNKVNDLSDTKADATTLSDLRSRVSDLETKVDSDTNSQKKSTTPEASVATRFNALLVSAIVGSIALFQMIQ